MEEKSTICYSEHGVVANIKIKQLKCKINEKLSIQIMENPHQIPVEIKIY